MKTSYIVAECLSVRMYAYLCSLVAREYRQDVQLVTSLPVISPFYILMSGLHNNLLPRQHHCNSCVLPTWGGTCVNSVHATLILHNATAHGANYLYRCPYLTVKKHAYTKCLPCGCVQYVVGMVGLYLDDGL